MPRYSRRIAVPLTVTSDGDSWEYKHLTDIQILESPTGPYARLICEHDCGGEMFTASCIARNFVYLEPYAQWLQANREDPWGSETPVVPVFFARSGRAFFSVRGARADHPELPAQRKRVYVHQTGRLEKAHESASNPLHWIQNLFRQ